MPLRLPAPLASAAPLALLLIDCDKVFQHFSATDIVVHDFEAYKVLCMLGSFDQRACIPVSSYTLGGRGG
jgi:hypothetical protein